MKRRFFKKSKVTSIEVLKGMVAMAGVALLITGIVKVHNAKVLKEGEKVTELHTTGENAGDILESQRENSASTTEGVKSSIDYQQLLLSKQTRQKPTSKKREDKKNTTKKKKKNHANSKTNDENTITTTVDGEKAVKGEVLVKYKKANGKFSHKDKKVVVKGDGIVEVRDNIRSARIAVVKIDENETIETAMAKLKRDPEVESVEPNYLYSVHNINSNDTHKDVLWGLHNTGQTIEGRNGKEDADIDFPQAMEIYNNNNSAIVAVIDTGVMYDHPDLQDNMLTEKGHDFANNDNDAYPINGDSHGTHVAGIIAASYNNGRGVIGVSPDSKIMNLNVCKFDDCRAGGIGFLSTDAIVEAIYYAADHNAKVINASFGGPGSSEAMRDAIQYFGDKGGLFITSAGNGGNDGLGDNNDIKPQYPASYHLDNMIVVAATDNKDNLAYFSNYGANSVDIAAPGVDIYSTITKSSTFFDEALDEEFEDGLSGYDLNPADAWQVKEDTYGDESLVGGHLDAEGNYLPSEKVVITSGGYSLEGVSEASLEVGLECDTEYQEDSDYLSIQVSADGNTFEEIDRLNEVTLDEDNIENDGPSDWQHLKYDLAKGYLSNNFQFRFEWNSNDNDLVGTGCFVDYVVINTVTYNRGSEYSDYAYFSGTSMSAPYVAGLAGLIWGQNPDLTYTEVKDIILTSGDDLEGLQNKTVTGKRINAFNALNMLTAPILSEVMPISSPTGNVNPQYTFHSNKEGSITYLGKCVGNIEQAVKGDNVVTFTALQDGIYDDCKIIVTDKFGNQSNELMVKEFVIDTLPPSTPTINGKITNSKISSINGTANSTDYLTVQLNGVLYAEGDGYLIDNGDNTWILNLPVNNELVTDGKYEVIAKLKDEAGNISIDTTENEIVIDTIKPVITLNGDSEITLIVGEEYVEPGATCNDNVDEDCEVVISGDTVNTAVPGTYVIIYNAQDSAGNSADPISRTVRVKEGTEDKKDEKEAKEELGDKDDKNVKDNKQDKKTNHRHSKNNKKKLSKPKNLKVECYDGYVKIKWKDISKGEDGYKIRRRIKGEKDWTKVATVKHKKKYSYKDTTSLKSGVEYEWKVRAYRNHKRGKWSTKVKCVIPGKATKVKQIQTPAKQNSLPSSNNKNNSEKSIKEGDVSDEKKEALINEQPVQININNGANNNGNKVFRNWLLKTIGRVRKIVEGEKLP